MDTRHRLLAALDYAPLDRLPNFEFGYWEETIRRWHAEGLPRHLISPQEVESYFGLEGIETLEFVPVINGLWPPFPRHVLSEGGGRKIVQDENGVIYEQLAEGESIPRYLRFPIASKRDWEVFRRERLDWTREDRVTGSLVEFVHARHQQGMPVRFDAGSLYGWLRNWMGVENLSIALLEEPAWVASMMDHLVHLTIHLVRTHITADMAIDIAWWWEDMCYNHGPLLSPRLFSQLMIPRYREVTQELQAHGIRHSAVDCDGKIYELVPGWLEAGIDVMFPIEALHTSPLLLREQFGDRVRLIGGVNKLALIAGPSAIDRELANLVPLVAQGGYIPTIDHRVPPDVSLQNYLYYLERKKALLALGAHRQ
ncbi:MAG: uroporphyrinogen decarboxylase family protein [candidate division KSB1 bacterium]|nr:uroporphyrinogen decarboxylase family protein [candidate division KSB1 bacterium]